MMLPVDFQVWWIKLTIKSRRSHIIHHGPNQITLDIDTMKIQMTVRFQNKSCITADYDPLCCEISFS
jgi:hypothetical protein